jgi:chitodextrinase
LAAPADRTPPTTPANLRVTGTGPYSVSLAWNASSDKSGISQYVICCGNTQSMTVPGGATSAVYTAGLEPGRPFSLRVWAVDAAGNYSKPSNTVSGTLPPDIVAPGKPVVSVTDVGPTHVTLAWSAVDNAPSLWFTVTRDGAVIEAGLRATSMIVPLLQPETTHVFVVTARDFGGNISPPSDPLTVTTRASNPDDVTPPSTPASFATNSWGDCEAELTWSESTDDLDPQWIIEYEIGINGVYDHSTTLRHTRTTVYGTQNGTNTFSVVAVDTAGNRSQPATATAELVCLP